MPSVLDLSSPPGARWFQESFGSATPPQELGWPCVARGENELILAPTGSGKTVAAFLYTINELVTRRGGGADGGPWRPRGLRLAAARLGGRPLVAVEAWARRLVPLADLSAGERREVLSLLVRLVRCVGQRPSIRVETWDGAPAAAGEVVGDLAALGFIRDDQAMVLYRSFRGSV